MTMFYLVMFGVFMFLIGGNVAIARETGVRRGWGVYAFVLFAAADFIHVAGMLG